MFLPDVPSTLEVCANVIRQDDSPAGWPTNAIVFASISTLVTKDSKFRIILY